MTWYAGAELSLAFPCNLPTVPFSFFKEFKKENFLFNMCFSIFGAYGLEIISVDCPLYNFIYTDLNGKPSVLKYKSDHIRACLDLFEHNKFDSLQGQMQTIFPKTETRLELVQRSLRLRDSVAWRKIKNFLECEFEEKFENIFKNGR